jgi:hypothetical protein
MKAGRDYAERWKVEKDFARPGNPRGLLARHERYPSIFRAFSLVAFILMFSKCYRDGSYGKMVTMWP